MSSAEYLIQYGRPGYVGRFRGDLVANRGDAVVIRSPRGVEIGEVLCVADARFAGSIDPAAGGDLLRHATSTDHADDGQEMLVLAEAQRLTSHLPMLILDVEVMLDGPIIVHAAFWAPCDADPVLAQLSTTLGRPVRLLDVSQTPTVDDPPEPACGTGCGSGGCSSESGCSTKSGGCSTSTCSRHAVKSADDLTAYFAALRKQMESTFGRRTSLN